MNTSSFVKKIGALSLLISVDGAEGMQAEQMLAINQKIEELANTMHHAMLQQGDQDISYAQIENSIRSHVGVRFIKDLAPKEQRPSIDDYLNLQGEDRIKAHAQQAAKPHKHHHHHHGHGKHHQKKSQNPPAKLAHAMPPSQKTFTQAGVQEFTSQLVSVPIDEVKAITMKISTTYARDEIDSVTLKAFRKVIGYDTFESILKEERNEKKDTDDHYNITVSMMVRRIPEPKAEPTANAYNGGEPLAPKLDKGFPYDDDGDVSESTVSFKKKVPQAKTNLAVLNGENVTKESLVNLLKDASSPVTQELVQLDSDVAVEKPVAHGVKLAQRSDADILSSLLGENITRAALKNLVTDKPAPITMKLAQTSSSVNNLIKLEKGNNPTATVDGVTYEGMVGDEEIHGSAMVGGAAVTYKGKNQK